MAAFWAKYGTETTFAFPMIKRGVVDFAQSADWTPAAADVAVSKNLGNLADATNAPAIVGGTPTRGASVWKWTATATELQAAVIDVQIVDAATKAVEDQALKIYTYGNASAFFAGDWSDIVRLGLTALPNAAAGGNGGIPTADAGNAITLPSIPAGWITAAGIAADAITAAKVAADVTTEIQSGLATSAELAKVPKSDGTVAFNATAVAGMQSGLATASALATAQSDLDILTGTDGVTLATSQPNYAPATAAQATSIEADTQDLQTQIGTAGAGLTALGDTRLGNLDAAVSTRLASASYAAPLDAAGTRTAVGLASANLDTQLGNIVADTNELQTDWTDGGRLDVILDARASQTSVDDVPTNAELAAAIITGLTTALTEGYRGTGATGSVRDLLYELLANITEFTITSTTKTAKKLDGSTTAKTYTLNDATTPTGITETT